MRLSRSPDCIEKYLKSIRELEKYFESLREANKPFEALREANKPFELLRKTVSEMDKLLWPWQPDDEPSRPPAQPTPAPTLGPGRPPMYIDIMNNLRPYMGEIKPAAFSKETIKKLMARAELPGDRRTYEKAKNCLLAEAGYPPKE